MKEWLVVEWNDGVSTCCECFGTSKTYKEIVSLVMCSCDTDLIVSI